MPEISVWPVSASVARGRSGPLRPGAAARSPACPGRPWSSARSPPRSPAPGSEIDSRMTGLSWSQSVSPVIVLFSPITAAMSPASTPDVLALVGVHLQQAADPLTLALRGVVDVGAGLEHAGVDADVGQLADVRVGDDLERQSARTARSIGAAHDRSPVGARVDARRPAARRAATAGYRTTASSSSWTPLFSQRAAAEDRHELARRSLPGAAPRVARRRGSLAFEVAHQRVARRSRRCAPRAARAARRAISGHRPGRDIVRSAAWPGSSR